jgi:hypothetical protein
LAVSARDPWLWPAPPSEGATDASPLSSSSVRKGSDASLVSSARFGAPIQATEATRTGQFAGFSGSPLADSNRLAPHTRRSPWPSDVAQYRLRKPIHRRACHFSQAAHCRARSWPSLSLKASSSLSCWPTGNSGTVRQLFANAHPNQCASMDLGGLPWTECGGSKTARSPHRSGLPQENPLGRRRGRHSNPREASDL